MVAEKGHYILPISAFPILDISGLGMRMHKIHPEISRSEMFRLEMTTLERL